MKTANARSVIVFGYVFVAVIIALGGASIITVFGDVYFCGFYAVEINIVMYFF